MHYFKQLILIIAVILITGCSSEMTIEQTENNDGQVDLSFSSLSDSSFSFGGEHYKVDHSLSADFNNAKLTSENGLYEIK